MPFRLTPRSMTLDDLELDSNLRVSLYLEWFLEKRRDNRFFQNRMNHGMTRAERQIDNVGDGMSKDRSTFFQKPGRKE